jgi:hypothetical protein
MPEDDVPMRSVSVASDTSCLVGGNNKVSHIYMLCFLCGLSSRHDCLTGICLCVVNAARPRAHRDATSNQVSSTLEVSREVSSLTKRQIPRDLLRRQDYQNMEYGAPVNYAR